MNWIEFVDTHGDREVAVEHAGVWIDLAAGSGAAHATCI